MKYLRAGFPCSLFLSFFSVGGWQGGGREGEGGEVGRERDQDEGEVSLILLIVFE